MFVVRIGYLQDSRPACCCSEKHPLSRAAS